MNTLVVSRKHGFGMVCERALLRVQMGGALCTASAAKQLSEISPEVILRCVSFASYIVVVTLAVSSSVASFYSIAFRF